LREALARFKFQGALHVGPGLSDILVQTFHRHFDASQFDIIAPVPIHRNRLIKRGFNQSVVLSQRLSVETGVRLHRTALKKVKDTPPQVGLTRRERIENLKGSFAISNTNAIRDKRVLLVDDVATTGSTIAECSKIITAGKAARVDALVLALRSDMPREDPPESVPQISEGRV
jgi:ComF family protein